jgi:hypothetical protein
MQLVGCQRDLIDTTAALQQQNDLVVALTEQRTLENEAAASLYHALDAEKREAEQEVVRLRRLLQEQERQTQQATASAEERQQQARVELEAASRRAAQAEALLDERAGRLLVRSLTKEMKEQEGHSRSRDEVGRSEGNE